MHISIYIYIYMCVCEFLGTPTTTHTNTFGTHELLKPMPRPVYGNFPEQPNNPHPNHPKP